MMLFMSCAQIRALEKKKEAGKYAKKVKTITKRKEHKAANVVPVNPLNMVFKSK